MGSDWPFFSARTMTSEGSDPPLSKSAAKKLAAKQAKEAKKAETQARYKIYVIPGTN